MARPDQVPHGNYYRKICRLKAPVEFRRWKGHDQPEEVGVWPTGTLVKVTMVSRFGDCGITDRLNAESGYDSRVYPDDLEII